MTHLPPALPIFAALLLAGCFSMTTKEPLENPASLPQPQLASAFCEEGEERLHYVSAGDPEKPLVLFVHGSPGSWGAFHAFLQDPELVARAFLVAPDRPGFGESAPGRAEPSLARQAAALVPLLALGRSRVPAIVVGHSFGGPIAAQLAADQPGRVGGLLLIAPSIDPTLERHRWYNTLASWRLVQRLLPAEMITSNRELWPLAAELQTLLPRWPEIRVPVLVLQGDRDRLVAPANADFAARVLVHAEVEVERLPRAGHLIPWQHPRAVKKAILDLLERVEADPAG